MKIRLTREEIERIAVVHINDTLRAAGLETTYSNVDVKNIGTSDSPIYVIDASLMKIKPSKPRAAKAKKKNKQRV